MQRQQLPLPLCAMPCIFVYLLLSLTISILHLARSAAAADPPCTIHLDDVGPRRELGIVLPSDRSIDANVDEVSNPGDGQSSTRAKLPLTCISWLSDLEACPRSDLIMVRARALYYRRPRY